MKYAIDMFSGSMMYILSFMMSGTGARSILRFYLKNLRGCNIGITDGRDYEVRHFKDISGQSISSGIEVLRLLPQQSERLECWYY
jgi:hypothetical protein